jgi:PilZ domain-containing protein
MTSSGAANDKYPRKDFRTGGGSGLVRRRWDRLPIAIPVFVRGSDETGKKFVEFATAANLNAGGMLLLTRRALPTGLVVTLEIPTPAPYTQAPGQEAKNALSATVLYESYSEGYHQCGLEFTHPLLAESTD